MNHTVNRTRNVLAVMLGSSIFVHIAVVFSGRAVLPDWCWPHYAVHSSLEMLGAIIALWCAWKLIEFEQRRAGTSFNICIAGALTGMGLLDGFHALCHVGNNFVWFHSAATLVGGTLFSLVWLPKRIQLGRRWPAAVAIGILVLSLVSLTLPDYVPLMVQDGAFTTSAKLLSVLGGILMLAAAGRLVWSHFATGNDDDLLFCLHGTLFGLSAIMFGQSQLWDLPWWGWHLLRLLAYAFAVYFIYENDPKRALAALSEELIEHRARLEEEVRERTATLRAKAEALEANEARLKQQSELRAKSQLAALNMNQDIMLANKKLAEQAVQLDRANERLSRSNEELKQFAYVASHDLQEPLRKVNSFCQLLKDEYGDQLDDDANSYIHYVVDGAVRMRALVTDLLDYSRVETQGRELKPTDAKDACYEALENLQAIVENSAATISVGPLPTILADRVQLVQLFQNLFANALKYRGEAAPEIHVGVEERNGNWAIFVKDNGIGMESQFFDRIFVMFQRLHARDEYSGTGIGLAICKRIVERLRGRMWVESEPHVGSTFFIEIPKLSKSTTADMPKGGATGNECRDADYAQAN